ncbi:hypothetical protein VTK26DRAFT_4221 [Humicola hyalothermophila]
MSAPDPPSTRHHVDTSLLPYLEFDFYTTASDHCPSARSSELPPSDLPYGSSSGEVRNSVRSIDVSWLGPSRCWESNLSVIRKDIEALNYHLVYQSCCMRVQTNPAPFHTSTWCVSYWHWIGIHRLALNLGFPIKQTAASSRSYPPSISRVRMPHR